MPEKQPTREGIDDERAGEGRARAKAHGLTVAQRPETVEADQASAHGEAGPPTEDARSGDEGSG
jgi:hypothetical protein